MLISVEGGRGLGKTFLIDKLPEEIKKHCYKLDFYPFYMKFNLGENAMYFSYGKDLQIMQLCKEGLLKSPIISDRSILSSVVYNIFLQRHDKQATLDYFQYMIDNYLTPDMKFIYVDGEPFKGRVKDIWDDVDPKPQMDLYEEALAMLPKEAVIRFTNTFDEDAVHRFINLMQELTKGE